MIVRYIVENGDLFFSVSDLEAYFDRWAGKTNYGQKMRNKVLCKKHLDAEPFLLPTSDDLFVKGSFCEVYTQRVLTKKEYQKIHPAIFRIIGCWDTIPHDPDRLLTMCYGQDAGVELQKIIFMQLPDRTQEVESILRHLKGVQQ